MIGIADIGGGVLPQILAFLEVARRGNLSRAAEALYVSQPTLTARLKALESELGEQLFVRTRRGMRLTEAGEAFLPYAEHTVQAITDGRERLGELRRGIMGKLVLGAPPTVSTYALAELAGEPLVLFGRSSSYRAFTEAVFREAGVMPDSVLELDNIEAAKKMVEHGIGISLVPHSALTGELATGALSVVDLVDTTLPRREIVAVRRHDAGPPSGTVATFMALLSEVGSLIVGGEPPPPATPAQKGTSRPDPPLPALDT